jgi:hypothetical protein
LSDEELRSLERAARERPFDVEAAWLLARALERDGRRRALHLELARLARQGDAEARGRIAAWPVRPSLRSSLQPRAARPAALAKVSRMQKLEATSPMVAGVLATSRHLVVVHRVRGLTVLGLRDLEQRFSLRDVDGCREQVVALRGDDVVHATGAGLALRDAESGDVLATAELPGAPTHLSIEGDRAVVAVASESGEARLIGLDAGASFGRVLWSAPVEPGRAVVTVEASGPRAFAAIGRRIGLGPGFVQIALEARGLEDGVAAWISHQLGADDVAWVDELSLPASDERGLFAAWCPSPSKEEALVELDPATGEVSWRVHDGHRPSSTAFLRRMAFVASDDVVVFESPESSARQSARSDRLRVFDRATRAERWSAVVPGRDAGPGAALARDALYVTLSAGKTLALATLSLGDGAPALRVDLGIELGSFFRNSAHLLPLDGAVVVVAWSLSREDEKASDPSVHRLVVARVEE